ncbi:dual OB domain-containing protein [Leptolyngbya sp. GGD]|uniref:dual OB domain-containing protein n=1 Tax=Leptolyngbya sp. GGD TaxID=2997907 RepID=UPI00227CF6B5|nr:hypothetical protein [Leptolyngbya sp. GGD]MCY6494186.1 hypothetical protein [Leptolyngbya sp. GGD]
MPQIICLANSWKFEERCIAGIDRTTGAWIRPISDLYPEDGRVPPNVRLIENQEPALLDILEIPLASDGNDFGFESENRTIIAGTWRRVGQVKAEDLLAYCDNSTDILHTSEKYVSVSYLQSLPFAERRTLQLIYVPQLAVREVPRDKGGRKWLGTIVTKAGQQLSNLSITDPAFVARLEYGYVLRNPCLVTVSLSMPYQPSGEWTDAVCWKLIAGVIELTESDQIMVEIRRLGWSLEQGRSVLQERFGRRSRTQLNQQELIAFLTYLKSL